MPTKKEKYSPAASHSELGRELDSHDFIGHWKTLDIGSRYC